MSMPKEILAPGPILTRKQSEAFQPRRPREIRQVYDREAVKEFLSGRITREEMLRRTAKK